jgi:mRNA interferase MazF
MVIAQGDVVWASLREPIGSEPGYDRPVVILQCNAFNQSKINTAVCIPLTSALKWARSPSAVLLNSRATGLDQDSVAQAHMIVTLDRAQLGERVGRVSDQQLGQLFGALDATLGR